MRYKIIIFLFYVILFCEYSEENLQGPPSETKRKQSDGNVDVNPNIDDENDLKIVSVSESSNEINDDESKSDPDQADAVNLLILNQAVWLEKMVQEIDGLKYNAKRTEVETNVNYEIPPLPEEVLRERELTPEEEEGVQIYDEAISLLSKTKPNQKKAYSLLETAASKGNPDAKGLVAWAHVFGNPLPQNIEKAKSMFYELSSVGNADGHMGLGFLFATGLSVNVSQAKALVYYTFAALDGNVWAQMALAYRHWAGIGQPPGCEHALKYYRVVADKVSQAVSFGGGSAVQRVKLLDELENGYTSGILDNDLIEYYQLLAEKGDVQAQVGLGQLHYQGGRGVELDYQKALHYFTQAANSGNAIAMAYLGKIYLDGSDDIQQDTETALKYFKKASDLNNPVGQSGLGLMYLYGRGVNKNYGKAFQYFMAAADQGWVDGQLQLGIMHFNGLGVKRDFKLANKYFSLASQSGHVLAYYNLAQMHAQGTGIMRSCPTAVELYKNVAERGKWSEILMQAHNDYRESRYDEAFAQYALLSELGYEVAQSNAAFLLDRNEVPRFSSNEALIRALQYWSRAAAQGYSAAQVKLGDYYYYGLGTAVDYETAASHYRLASDHQHNAQAMFNLGYMHEQGLGMAKDMHLAKRCYDLAAETSADAKVPVALALLKLNLMFNIQSLQESSILWLNFDDIFGSNWDLYLITMLIATLGIIVYFRRPQGPHPPQREQAPVN